MRGAQHEESDLDVLVTFADPLGLFGLVRLENELSEHFGVDVDLVPDDASVAPEEFAATCGGAGI